MAKTLTAKTRKLKVVRGTPDDPTPVTVVGTKRWRAEVPLHLQKPFAKALHAMENNDVAQACLFFGDAMNACQTWDEAKPVMFFGAQVMGHRWLELRGAVPDHAHIPEWKHLTEMVLRGSVEMHPDDAVARHNLGRFLQDTDRREEALACYRHTVLLDPTQVETWGNMADLYYQSGDRATAFECWERAVSLPTDKASGRLSQAYYWLRTGQYEKGWAAFNDRWKDMVFVRGYGRNKELGGNHWLGGPLAKDHALLLHGEQGLGDHVQFARYVPVLQAQGIHVAGIETRAVLKRWMEASFPGVPVYSRDVDPLPEFTHHCSTMDLPGILGTTVETIPPPVAPEIQTPPFEGVGPVLCGPSRDTLRSTGRDRASPARHDAEAHASPSEKNIPVGIAWEGAKGNAADGIRSIPHEALRHLADIPGVTWVSLQFSEHAPIVGRSWLGQSFVDGTVGCLNAYDTAAVMRGLDLIVTVDTLTAHLAGTLGVPTLLLQRFCREWRWMDQGERTAWYPSITQMTQARPGDWDELLARVRARLATFAGS